MIFAIEDKLVGSAGASPSHFAPLSDSEARAFSRVSPHERRLANDVTLEGSLDDFAFRFRWQLQGRVKRV